MTAPSPIIKPAFKFQPRQAEINQQFYLAKARNELIYGGARSGKTVLFTKKCCARALGKVGSRHVILRLRTVHVRQSIWLDTLPKVLRLCWPDFKPLRHEQDGYMQFPNKTVPKEDYAELWIAGLDDKERTEKVLGKEFSTIYFNECSQIPYASVLIVQTRLAQKIEGLRNKAFYDLNPVLTGHWSHRLFIDKVDPTSRERRLLPDPQNYVHAYLNPVDNAENIDPEYLKYLQNMPERQRKRFYEGKYSTEQEGQLWSYEMIEQHRRNAVTPEELEGLGIIRVVVAVDPSGASGEHDLRADEIGITVTGQDAKGRGYLFEDASGLYSPEQWGNVTKEMYHKWGASRVIGEKNFGGDMVRAVIHGADSNIPYKDVVASRGKAVRAEPISALYERGRISHCGSFPVLEDEQLNFTTVGYMGSGSPNHCDSLVWGFTELFEHEVRTGLIELLKETTEGLQAGTIVIKNGMPVDKEGKADPDEPQSGLAKIATSKLIKPAVGDDVPRCPHCGSIAIVRVGKLHKCNQCGQMIGELSPVLTQNRASLQK